MNVIRLLDNPEMKPLQKRFKVGEYIFREGDAGDAMYIILDGSVKLVAEKEEEKFVVAVLERGQFFGERAILESTQTKRWCAAMAKSHVILLRLSGEDFANLKKTNPELGFDILTYAFRETATRLETSNRLTNVLRPTDNLERFIQLTLHFSRTRGTAVIEGRELLLNPDNYSATLGMTREDAELCLKILREGRVLTQKINDYFVITNEAQLEAFLPELKRRFAAAASAEPVEEERRAAGGIRGFFRGGKK